MVSQLVERIRKKDQRAMSHNQRDCQRTSCTSASQFYHAKRLLAKRIKDLTVPIRRTMSPRIMMLHMAMRMEYQLWKVNGFSLYLSGAAQLEKCLNERPWQFSVSAAAGAEYAITPHLGLYLEPSLGYYFDDGTSFEHYYKEHSLAPSIEFGLCLHIKSISRGTP